VFILQFPCKQRGVGVEAGEEDGAGVGMVKDDLKHGSQGPGELLLRVRGVVVELELDVEPDAAVDALERLLQRAERVVGAHVPPHGPAVLLELPEQRLPSLTTTSSMISWWAKLSKKLSCGRTAPLASCRRP
jgi:hypothetical protein